MCHNTHWTNDDNQSMKPLSGIIPLQICSEPVSWLQNNHIQTIGGYIFRKLANDQHPNQRITYNFAYIPRTEPWYQTIQRMVETSFNVATNNVRDHVDDSISTPQPFWDRRERINTPDGDFFHVDIKQNNQNHWNANGNNENVSPKSIVILLHGLQSNRRKCFHGPS